MALFDKVKSVPNICGVELAFNGDLLPSIIEGYQPFINSLMQNTDFTKTYFGVGSVSFSEESDDNAAGDSWTQKLVIRFPSSDDSRAYRLATFHKVKFIRIKLTNGRDLVMGRNDFTQNARPLVKTSTNANIGQAEFQTVSITPLGYTPNPDAGGLPDFIPLDLISDI